MVKEIIKTKLSYDGRQLITRIPKEIERKNNLIRGDEVIWEDKDTLIEDTPSKQLFEMNPILKESFKLKVFPSLRGLHRTDIEIIMGNALRENKIDFAEQYPIRGKYGYVADFFIESKKLIIECDGEAWHKPKNDHDRKRDAVMKKKGFKILRFTGTQIKEDLQSCINKVMGAIQ